MPFQEQTKMQGRQKLIFLVRNEGMSVAAAARHCAVSRPTAYKWLDREKEVGLEALAEQSRRPHALRPGVDASIVEQVLALKKKYPRRGAGKLYAMLWPPRQPHQTGPLPQPPISLRTVERILERAGLTAPKPAPQSEWQRFERSNCNELWQMDFKGLEKRHGFRPFTILDDCSRYLLTLSPLENGATETVWNVLWSVFGEYGLPDCILSDNGDGFNSVFGLGPTPLQAKLWRLGIATTHGRVAHPQTQGKIERMHRSLEAEWSQALRPADFEAARRAYPQIRHEYNWERPHQALGQLMPGVVYSVSKRVRPPHLPPAVVSSAGQARKVDGNGRFCFRGHVFLAGRGLAGESVEVREEEGSDALFYANRRVAPLDKIKLD